MPHLVLRGVKSSNYDLYSVSARHLLFPHLNSGLSGINDVGVNETIWQGAQVSPKKVPLAKKSGLDKLERRTWSTGQSTGSTIYRKSQERSLLLRWIFVDKFCIIFFRTFFAALSSLRLNKLGTLEDAYCQAHIEK